MLLCASETGAIPWFVFFYIENECDTAGFSRRLVSIPELEDPHSWWSHSLFHLASPLLNVLRLLHIALVKTH